MEANRKWKSLSNSSVSAGTPGWPILVSRVQTSFVGRSHLNTLRPPAGTKQGKRLDTECDTPTLVFSEP